MKKKIFIFILSFLFIFAFEFIFILFNDIGLNNIFIKVLFSLLNALIINLLFIFNSRINKIIYFLVLGIISFIFMIQFFYYDIFDTLLSINSLFNSSDIIKFSDSLFNVILDNWYIILLYIGMFVGTLFLCKRIDFDRLSKKGFFVNIGLIFIIYLFCIGSLYIGDESLYSPNNLYFNLNNQRENIKVFGVLTATRLDLQRSILGFREKNLIEYKDSDGNNYVIDKDQYNVLDIDFDKVINNSSDNEVIEISKYLKSQSPSNKNDYTGLFEDKNLIFIVGESFSSLAIDKEITPTLYKLSNSGLQFNNFYTPLFPVSTADGQYILDTGLVPAEGTWSILDVHDKYYPYTYGNAFKSVGYNTYAFHNYDYDYYDRDIYFETMGFDKYLGNGNGLEDYMNFEMRPSSDYDMLKSTFDIYASDDKFLAYFVTMSGHRDYNIKHSIVKKNWDKVKDLDYSEKAKAYLATQIELDKALEELLNSLEDKGILDDTVIVLTGDHYPYGLTESEMKELSDDGLKDYHFDRFHAPLIIYNPNVDEVSDKYCYSMDVLPTILNLFGIEYDSRLLMGRDIFSDNEEFILFSDRSFITSKGKYYADSSTFIEFGDEKIDEDYVANIKNEIYLKYRNSRLILENDYYKYLFK